MSDRPPRDPFDPHRAAFWLIAFVIGVHATVVVSFAGACVFHASTIVTTSTLDCDPNSRLMALLAAVLAAALAFAGVAKK